MQMYRNHLFESLPLYCVIARHNQLIEIRKQNGKLVKGRVVGNSKGEYADVFVDGAIHLAKWNGLFRCWSLRK